MRKTVNLITAALCASRAVYGQAINEPTSGVLFGAWLDTSAGDTPVQFNQRLGYNASVFQIAQAIPLPPYNWVTGAGGPAPESGIEYTDTNAAVFLTVYPSSLTNVTVDDLTALGNQILNYTQNYSRQVFLRWGPEMNGNWNPYGLQPIAYVSLWRQMHDVIKAIVPNVALVWAPNEGVGYPYGESFPTNATEAAAIDTTGDGVFDQNDDPFAPYFPGFEYIDWAGMSVYYKGPGGADVNAVMTEGYCHDLLVGWSPDQQFQYPNFYDIYCNANANVACMYSESGAAFHDSPDVPVGIGDLAIKTNWINDCVMNATFFNSFPRLKLFMQFEYTKFETGNDGNQDSRDFRLTNNTQVLAAFQSSIAAAPSIFSWATYSARQTHSATQVIDTATLASTCGLGGTDICTPTQAGLVFQTARYTFTGTPDLFGKSLNAATKLRAVAGGAAASLMMVVVGAAFMYARL